MDGSAMRMFVHFYRVSKEGFKVFVVLEPSNTQCQGTATAQFIKAQKLNHILGSGMVSL